jgi:microcystin-dependent protein
MSDPFVAEIRILGCNFAPRGWAFCNGQILPISQNTALFSLLGTNYGGNGTSNFGLPNLQGAAPMHWGQGPGLSDYQVGESSGQSSVTLLASEIPSHSHSLQGSSRPANNPVPGPTNLIAASRGFNAYGAATNLASADPLAVGSSGSSLPHNNMQPYLVLNFCIALQGVFPPRS